MIYNKSEEAQPSFFATQPWKLLINRIEQLLLSHLPKKRWVGFPDFFGEKKLEN